MRLDPVFNSEPQFRQAFVAGLESMLEYPELGAYILVLANAAYDEQVYAQLSQRLAQRFQQLVSYYLPRLQQRESLPDAIADLQVFEQLTQLGFDALQPNRLRTIGDWLLQFNQLRSFRPNRMSAQALSSLQQPFDEGGFHFDKAFLQREIFWQGDIDGRGLRLLYNKFPFADLHTLLVIDADRHKPQWLSVDAHDFVWQLLLQLGRQMPGVGIGYNSIGAYASVNHQHFQMYVSDRLLPVESSQWKHNGGQRNYPVKCEKFTDAAQAWRCIEMLHSNNQPYNLLYRPGTIYCLARAFQGSYSHSDWAGGFAWAELCGCVTLSSEQDYRRLQAGDVENEMQLL